MLYMYYNNNNQVKFKEAYQEVSKIVGFDVKHKNRFLKIVLDNFKAILQMRKGMYKQASTLIYNCLTELNKEFA